MSIDIWIINQTGMLYYAGVKFVMNKCNIKLTYLTFIETISSCSCSLVFFDGWMKIREVLAMHACKQSTHDFMGANICGFSPSGDERG